MKRYCFDTSGVSKPLEDMPADIHESMWKRIEEFLSSGDIAITTEIYDEMIHIGGSVGDCVKASKAQLIMEVQNDSWDWKAYLGHATRMQDAYKLFISELNGNKKGTIGLNDLSIVALAKTIGLPVVSMESRIAVEFSKTKRRIPNVCDVEGIEHCTFSDFLRKEKIKL